MSNTRESTSTVHASTADLAQHDGSGAAASLPSQPRRRRGAGWGLRAEILLLAGPAVIVFLAFVIFLLVRFVKKISEEVERKHEEAPQGPTEVDLLTEIRDELKKRP